MDAMDKMENRAEVDDATRSSILKYLTTYAREKTKP
jgi:hypothetical protein